MRRVVLVATLALVFAPTTQAFADDNSDDPGLKPFISQSDDGDNRPGADDPERKQKHDQLRKEHDDVYRVLIPPVTIKPGYQSNPDVYQLPYAPNPDDLLDANSNNLIDPLTDNLTGVNDGTDFTSSTVSNQTKTLTSTADKGKAVQIKDLVLTKTTPMDEFLVGALTTGLTLIAVAAVLLGFSAANSLRLRKKAKSE